jgi:hypothetical protein
MSEVEPEEGLPEEGRPEVAPAEDDAEATPETVPDDWLEQKPFDPAGR